MSKKLWSVAGGGVLVAALTLGAAGSASAFPIYEDANYGGYAYQATWAKKDGLGTLNKKGSSMKAPAAGKTFYESRGYTGRSVKLRGNVPRLADISTGLGWLQNWNDRIQSYK
ncbi:MAG: hypothetical protein ACTJHU_01800 [Mycetocola sp.]